MEGNPKKRIQQTSLDLPRARVFSLSSGKSSSTSSLTNIGDTQDYRRKICKIIFNAPDRNEGQTQYLLEGLAAIIQMHQEF